MKEIKVSQMQRMGGYIYWDWKFPFVHRKEEWLILGNDSGLWKYKSGKLEKVNL